MLEQRNKLLEAENSLLRQKIEELERKQKHKKTSRNSSIPPSKDENRPKRNQSLRKRSNKKVGGQKGHKGYYLKMPETPDVVEKHVPKYCTNCGKEFKGEPTFLGKRQILDIPEIKAKWTEHQIYSFQCSCGACVKADYPLQASNNVCYGKNIESLIAYLSVRQYIPVNRIVELLYNVMNIKMSGGTVINLLDKYTEKCKPIYEKIKEKIECSKVVGTDETGLKVNGAKHWIWAWQTPQLSYLVESDNRGFETIAKELPNGLPNSILVQDCWPAHFKMKTKSHQLCMAHLLRELNYFIEQKQSDWSSKFKELILVAMKLKDNFGESDFSQMFKRLKQKAHELIHQDLKVANKKLQAFKRRMIKYEDYLFKFLEYPEVPYDNNGSERSIRNVKVKQKVSTQFRSSRGAQNFAILRSVIDTTIKNDQNVLQSLNIIGNLQAE